MPRYMFSFDKRILALVIALAVAIGAGSYAAYSAIVISNNLNATGSINTSPGLSVLDSSCSTVLTSLSFPPQPPTGLSTSSITVCVKNTGNEQFYLVSSPSSVVFSGLPLTINGSFASNSNLPLLLHPGETDTVTLTLTVDNNGTTTNGTFSFTVSFTGYSTSTG